MGGQQRKELEVQISQGWKKESKQDIEAAVIGNQLGIVLMTLGVNSGLLS